MAIYAVIVGNIGTVLITGVEQDARTTYSTYVEQSKTEVGRAGGEDVTLIKDDDILQEFVGSRSEAGEQ
jgi:hypothetical protein